MTSWSLPGVGRWKLNSGYKRHEGALRPEKAGEKVSRCTELVKEIAKEVVSLTSVGKKFPRNRPEKVKDVKIQSQKAGQRRRLMENECLHC